MFKLSTMENKKRVPEFTSSLACAKASAGKPAPSPEGASLCTHLEERNYKFSDSPEGAQYKKPRVQPVD
jgi:hypothetical protein